MTIDPRSLLIATTNHGKRVELEQLLSGAAITIADLGGFMGISEVAETGRTFLENARLKAAGYAAQTKMLTLADDSGLEIDALGGRPGVLSARYAGDSTSFAAKMRLILDEIAETSDRERKARFVAAMAVADDTGKIIHSVEGVCSGRIAHEIRGTGGFGYDPIFIPEGYDLTFGELPGSIKVQISHRAKAFALLIPFLRDIMVV